VTLVTSCADVVRDATEEDHMAISLDEIVREQPDLLD